MTMLSGHVARLSQLSLIAALFLAVLFLAACAPMVPSTPVAFTPVAPETAQARELELRAPLALRLPTGYSRTLAAGSRWRAVGQVPQGTVYQPIGSVFSIEGRQVHEAYLVVDRTALTGFYLPGEARFSPLEQALQLPTGALP